MFNKMYDIITFGSATRDINLKSKAFKAVKDPSVRAGNTDFINGEGICLSLGSKVEVNDIKYTSLGGLTGVYIINLFLPGLMAVRFNDSLQDALNLKMPLVFNDGINRMNFSKFNEAYFHLDLVSCSF